LTAVPPQRGGSEVRMDYAETWLTK
jgi:hypothetical protein